MKPNLDALKLLYQELAEMSVPEWIFWAWGKSGARLMMTKIFHLWVMQVVRIQKKCQRFKFQRVLYKKSLGFTLIFPKFSIIIF